jgi:HSP20 family protein
MLWTDWNNWNGFLDPWKELEHLNHVLSGSRRSSSGEFPAVNMWASADDMVVTTEIPGIDPKDIDISVAGKSVTLRGSRTAEEPGEQESFHRRERRHGRFSKTIELPFSVETDKVKARFSKGVLSITLPRAEAEKPRKIEITS